MNSLTPAISESHTQMLYLSICVCCEVLLQLKTHCAGSLSRFILVLCVTFQTLQKYFGHKTTTEHYSHYITQVYLMYFSIAIHRNGMDSCSVLSSVGIVSQSSLHPKDQRLSKAMVILQANRDWIWFQAAKFTFEFQLRTSQYFCQLNGALRFQLLAAFPRFK